VCMVVSPVTILILRCSILLIHHLASIRNPRTTIRTRLCSNNPPVSLLKVLNDTYLNNIPLLIFVLFYVVFSFLLFHYSVF